MALHTRLEEIIIKQIFDANEMISFRQFMDICLYYPKLGYYQTDSVKIGRMGDFYTSPNASSVFGEVIADYIYKAWQKLNYPANFSIIEYGAGNGQLALTIILELNKYTEIKGKFNYYILEISENHQKIQKNVLHNIENVFWLKDIKKLKNIEGIILSNELIDAFPVNIVRFSNNSFLEKCVGYDDVEGKFIYKYRPASKEISDYILEQKIDLIEGQELEINFLALDWLKDINEVLIKGYILTIDYGELAEELYSPHRKNGTLLCYYKHTVNDEPLQRIGLQDITSHVNFSQLINYGEKLGFEKVAYQTQQQFLIEQGIMTKFINHSSSNPFSEQFKRNASIKQLIMPSAMGNAFKVLIQKK